MKFLCSSSQQLLPVEMILEAALFLTYLAITNVATEFSMNNGFNDCKCGEVQQSGKRLLGGNEAEVGEYPWQALIVTGLRPGVYSSCGGSLINSQVPTGAC